MGSNAPIALKDLLRSPPAGLDGLMDAVGATGNEQIQAAAQTVLDDLYRVQDLVNLFSQRLNMARRRRSAVGGGSAGSDIQAAMYNTSTTLSEVSQLYHALWARQLTLISRSRRSSKVIYGDDFGLSALRRYRFCYVGDFLINRDVPRPSFLRTAFVGFAFNPEVRVQLLRCGDWLLCTRGRGIPRAESTGIRLCLR